MKRTKQTDLITYIVIVVLSILLGCIFSNDSLNRHHYFNDNAMDITGSNYECANASFDASTGEYVVLDEDPSVKFTGLDGEYRGIIISLKGNAPYDIPVKIYYKDSADADFSESRTQTGKFLEGDLDTSLKLPRYSIDDLRIDIDSACVIESILIATSPIKTEYTVTSGFIISSILRAVVIFIVLIFAYLSHVKRCENGGRFFRGMIIDEEKPGKNHIYEYDYIRTLAAILVIMMHSICDIFIPNVTKGMPGYGTFRVVLALSLVCNTLYIMLSGALTLQPREESIKDFFVKRMVKVLIPMLCYFGLYMLLGYRKEVFGQGILNGLKYCGKSLLSGRPDYMPHVWLVYTILGLYILTPLIRIVLKYLTDKQLFGFLITGFVINVLVTYLPLCGCSFGIDTPIAGWLGIFVLGYYMTTKHAAKYYNIYIVLGIIALISSFAMIYYNPDLLAYTANWTPNMWLVGCGVFALFNKFKNLFGRRNVVIAALSKYNFSIMLIHILLLMKFVLPYGWALEYEYGHLKLVITGIIIVTFILSYIVSVIFDNTAVAAAMYVYSMVSDKLTRKKGK